MFYSKSRTKIMIPINVLHINISKEMAGVLENCVIPLALTKKHSGISRLNAIKHWSQLFQTPCRLNISDNSVQKQLLFLYFKAVHFLVSCSQEVVTRSRSRIFEREQTLVHFGFVTATVCNYDLGI